MATARKLPSGHYRVRVFSHYDYSSGKKKAVYESFTAKTKVEAEQMATTWEMDKSSRGEDITVADAVERYIASRTAVLSPSTIKGYRQMQRTGFNEIGHVKLRSLTPERIQLWVSNLSLTRSPKTTRNIYGLFRSSVTMFAPKMDISVRLPASRKKRYNLPPDEDVQKLLEHVKGTELWLAIMLAYYYGLRRGEICALTRNDLIKDTLTISKDMVGTEHNTWVIKDIPKTEDSYRSLRLVEPVLSAYRAIDDKVINCTPNALLARFRRAVRFSHIKPFNFHLLRHCYATRAATLGVPDIITARLGGWRPGSPILKSVYQNAMDDELLKQMDKMNSVIPT